MRRNWIAADWWWADQDGSWQRRNWGKRSRELTNFQERRRLVIRLGTKQEDWDVFVLWPQIRLFRLRLFIRPPIAFIFLVVYLRGSFSTRMHAKHSKFAFQWNAVISFGKIGFLTPLTGIYSVAFSRNLHMRWFFFRSLPPNSVFHTKPNWLRPRRSSSILFKTCNFLIRLIFRDFQPKTKQRVHVIGHFVEDRRCNML